MACGKDLFRDQRDLCSCLYYFLYGELQKDRATGTEKQLEEAARRDELTQMENRRSMQERFDRLPELAGTDAEVG